MKKIVMILGVSLMFTSMAIRSYAADTAPKIGYIDLQRILLQSDEGKKAKAALEKEFASRKKELNQKKQELENLQKSLEAQSSLLSRDALVEKQAEFVKKRDQFLKLVQQYDEELQKKDSELTKQILSQLQDIITEIGKKGNYSLIIEKSQGGILYAPESEDLTDKVMQLFNKRAEEQNKTEK
ncbi:MAG: OmpH family outer membrane protein [bacterium]